MRTLIYLFGCWGHVCCVRVRQGAQAGGSQSRSKWCGAEVRKSPQCGGLTLLQQSLAGSTECMHAVSYLGGAGRDGLICHDSCINDVQPCWELELALAHHEQPSQHPSSQRKPVGASVCMPTLASQHAHHASCRCRTLLIPMLPLHPLQHSGPCAIWVPYWILVEPESEGGLMTTSRMGVGRWLPFMRCICILCLALRQCLS